MNVRTLKLFSAANLSLSLAMASLAADAPKSVPVTIPAINFIHQTLENGLEVYSAEDHSSLTVAVHVWYHVGSKDDPNGRSGFAHLFEHMMFKWNEHLKPETFDNLT